MRIVLVLVAVIFASCCSGSRIVDIEYRLATIEKQNAATGAKLESLQWQVDVLNKVKQDKPLFKVAQ